jgi:hypothetical protein
MNNRLIVNCTVKFHIVCPFGITYMQSGSLTIGGINADYGSTLNTSGSWTGLNTTGFYCNV